MSGRMHQVFIAPGEEDTPLVSAPSPWIVDRRVYLPYEYWETIIEAIERQNPGCASSVERLAEWEDRTESFASASWEEVDTGIACLERFADQLGTAPPLVEEESERMPDVFTNGEIVRMIGCVTAVLRESIRLRKPYCVWVE